MHTTVHITCPHCGNDDVYRIHRTRLVKILSVLLPLRRYACYACLKKFYIREHSIHQRQASNHHAGPAA